MNLSEQFIRNITRRAKPDFQQGMVDNMNQLLDIYEINTPLRVSHFLAQAMHESADFSLNIENLNYSARGLLAVFPKYFDYDDAERFARRPEAIASRVYANRMGNGSEYSKDGWKYRGRGIFQLTGKNNYKKYGELLGVDLLENPDIACDPVISFQVACEFWKENKLNRYADGDDIRAITRAINGGYNGLDNRIEHYNKVRELLDGEM